MRIEDDTLALREIGAFWKRAYAGYKPNAQRFASPEMSRDLSQNRKHIKFAKIYNERGDQFIRQVTDMTNIGSIAGADLWVISWKPEGEPATYSPERR